LVKKYGGEKGAPRSRPKPLHPKRDKRRLIENSHRPRRKHWNTRGNFGGLSGKVATEDARLEKKTNILIKHECTPGGDAGQKGRRGRCWGKRRVTRVQKRTLMSKKNDAPIKERGGDQRKGFRGEDLRNRVGGKKKTGKP